MYHHKSFEVSVCNETEHVRYTGLLWRRPQTTVLPKMSNEVGTQNKASR